MTLRPADLAQIMRAATRAHLLPAHDSIAWRPCTRHVLASGRVTGVTGGRAHDNNPCGRIWQLAQQGWQVSRRRT